MGTRLIFRKGAATAPQISCNNGYLYPKNDLGSLFGKTKIAIRETSHRCEQYYEAIANRPPPISADSVQSIRMPRKYPAYIRSGKVQDYRLKSQQRPTFGQLQHFHRVYSPIPRDSKSLFTNSRPSFLHHKRRAST